jgi:serine/threonine protein kinase
VDGHLMTPEQIERVFGRCRLKMATGDHVEVFREAIAPGERRRYTKRFLDTTDGHFAHWTEREWRILARLIGHGVDCVPDVVQFDRGSIAGMQLVQTYDAGVTVDQWATLLPLIRDGRVYRHAFEDCAHWWALAHHSLIALKKIHQLQLIHLDIKGDNICIPLGPASFDCNAPSERLHPIFDQLALIDFAFALVSGEALTQPLPIGWQREYDYQSPRLLKALEEGRNGDLALTRQLDWRCDIYSLAAMLKRYLPDEAAVHRSAATGWTGERYDAAKSLIFALREHHDREAPQVHPHAALIHATGARLREGDLAASLAFGWTLARDIDVAPASASPLTPMTRLAPSIRVFVSPRERVSNDPQIAGVASRDKVVPLIVPPRDDSARSHARRTGASRAALAVTALIVVALLAFAAPASFRDVSRAVVDRVQTWADAMRPTTQVASAADTAKSTEPSLSNEPLPAKPPESEASPTPPVSDSPSPAAPPSEPVETNSPPSARPSDPIASPPIPPQVVSPSPSLARSTPRRAPPANNTASTNGKKTKANSAPSLAASSSKMISSKSTPRALPMSSANRLASSAHVMPPTSSVAKPGAAQTQALALAESRPAPTQVALVTPSVENATASLPSSSVQAPPSTPSNAPSVAATDRPEQIASAHFADAPTTPPPSPTRERARSSRAERSTDQGWFSQLLQLVGKKPAPIEDRQLQAAAPKRPVSEVPHTPPTAEPPAQVEPLPSIVQPKAVIALSPPPGVIPPPPTRPNIRDDSKAPRMAELPAKIPSPYAALPIQKIQEPPAESEAIDRDADQVFATEARRALRQVVPRIAAQAQSEVARVLWVAANANDPTQDRAVIEAAQSISVGDGSNFSQGIAPAEARRLNDEAMDAYWSRRNMTEAFDLQLKAFGANPYDAEIAGNLALLHLKPSRLQPETARQLALVALAYRGGRSRMGRFEDWTTYAIASALTGRVADARNALFVTVALSRNIERNCKTAMGALSNYGERLREPVEAMLNRIHMQGRGYESPYCSLPPKWAMGTRLQ